MWSRVFYDDFERADGAVGNSWTTTGADGSTGILSGDLFSTHSGGAGNEVRRYRRTTTAGSDRAVEVMLSSFAYRTLVVIADGTSGTYYAECTTNAVRLYRFVGATETTIAQVTHTASLGDVMRAEKRGAAFTVKMNGVTVLTATDSTFSVDGTYTAGVTFWTQSTTPTASIEDFAIYEWVTPPNSTVTPSSGSLLYLMDGSLQPTGFIREYNACVVTRRMYEPSTIDLRMYDYATISGARYLTFGADDEVFRIESVTITDGNECVVRGRSAVCDLEARTIPTAISGTSTSGALIAAVMGTLTGSRATVLTPGDLSYGTAASRQVVGGTVLDAVSDLALADGLGYRCRLSGGTAYLDLIQPAASDIVIGDALRNVGSSTYQTDTKPWRNYAYVNGEFGGAAVQVVYDATGGSERRELWVDGTVDATDLTLVQYQDKLAQEGAQALANTKRVEWVQAQTDVAVGLGDIVWYDGVEWAGYLMCTEFTVAYENGERRTATFGELPPTIAKTIRKATR